jgi:hypothetical protein
LSNTVFRNFLLPLCHNHALSPNFSSSLHAVSISRWHYVDAKIFVHCPWFIDLPLPRSPFVDMFFPTFCLTYPFLSPTVVVFLTVTSPFCVRCISIELSLLYPGPRIWHPVRSDLIGSDHPMQSDRIPGDEITNGSDGRNRWISNDIWLLEPLNISHCWISIGFYTIL